MPNLGKKGEECMRNNLYYNGSGCADPTAGKGINKKHAYILSMLYSSAMETDAYYINQVRADFNIN